MTLTEQIYAQALLLAGDVDDQQKQMLNVLCQGAAASLTARLRDGLTPEDCKADFIASASLFALSALSGVEENHQPEIFQAGDMSLHFRSKDAASNCLRAQAELMIAPYLKDKFAFMGV